MITAGYRKIFLKGYSTLARKALFIINILKIDTNADVGCYDQADKNNH